MFQDNTNNSANNTSLTQSSTTQSHWSRVDDKLFENAATTQSQWSREGDKPFENAATTHSQWSRVDDKLFEQALVTVPEGTFNRWEKISEIVGKSAIEVKYYFEALVFDVSAIDGGAVQVPDYKDFNFYWNHNPIVFDSSSKSYKGETIERKKGTPWTQKEHRAFLRGLQKYGKGDWRSISRNEVVSRTPTQVASHAQKYFLRQSAGTKERKRSSIHDITTVDDNPMERVTSEKQNWIAAHVPVQQHPPVLQQQQQALSMQQWQSPPLQHQQALPMQQLQVPSQVQQQQLQASTPLQQQQRIVLTQGNAQESVQCVTKL